jgi:alkanesulfonate monooxygenase SsuD/methylene tetrahydromethanopterin reductase-like flavin-dependent oxidoreductase (luciferase family)
MTREQPSAGTPDEVADALRATLDLFQTGLDLMRQNLRRRLPDATDGEIQRLLDEWLRHRPGAESGDCPGRPVDVKTRLA